ncbi:MAG: SIR2 family protein [Bacteroidota bacterium]
MVMGNADLFRKKVFLFGAGAALDWGGPKTTCDGDKLTFLPDHLPPHEITNRVCCLTHMIRETGFLNKQKIPVAESIYSHLQQRGIPDELLNFETIISFVEELFSYYAGNISKGFSVHGEGKLPAWIKDLFSYITKPVGDGTHHYSFSIPGREFPNDYGVATDVPPEQKFLEYLFQDIISGIVGHVSNYSFWSGNHSEVVNETNAAINSAFTQWIKGFADAGDSVRMYTLNYDRIFKHLLVDAGIDVFEGFMNEDGEAEEPGLFAPDPKRIVSDKDPNVYYNLHGCVDWRVEDENVNGLSSYQYYLSSFPHIETSLAVVELEKGRKILLSNIVSGYQKVQRTYLSPIRQMLSSFDRDCLEADEIFLVGYSYGDEHINEIVRNAKKYNADIKLTLINPCFDDKKFMMDFILHWGRVNFRIYQNDGDDIVSEQFKVRAIRKRFGEYLQSVTATS